MEERKNKTSKSKLEANKRYLDKHWRPNVAFPAYFRDWMEDLGIERPSTFIREAVQEKLEEVEKSGKPLEDYDERL